MKSVIASFAILSSILFASKIPRYSKVKDNRKVLGTYITQQSEIKTISSFEEEEKIEVEEVNFLTKYIKDNSLEVGREKVIQEGRKGKLIKKYRVFYWYGKEIKRELLNTKKEDPTNRIVAKGTRLVWRDVETHGERNVEDSTLRYWKKIKGVWATSYDKGCFGCSETTALGARVDYGVCAVDPNFIKLRTKIYVPGYGVCQALDVGGAIKGKRIDVGFYDLNAQSSDLGWKGAHYTDIYLLDHEEQRMDL